MISSLIQVPTLQLQENRSIYCITIQNQQKYGENLGCNLLHSAQYTLMVKNIYQEYLHAYFLIKGHHHVRETGKLKQHKVNDLAGQMLP